MGREAAIAMSSQIKTWIFQVVLWPIYLILRWCYEKCLLQTFDGIKICDITSSNDEERQKYCSSIVAALELIKKHDPKRYCRVQRHFAYILNRCSLTTGSYDDSLRLCEISFSLFKFEGDEEWEATALACTIIHEATHGVLCARNIPYDEAHYLRVERACHQEEARFARRVMPNVDLGEFDENKYTALYRMNRWQYAAEFFKAAFRTNEPAA